VSKQTRTFLNEPLKEKARSGLVFLEASELPHGPCDERLIDVSKHGIQCRPYEPPVILDPTPKNRIEELGDIIQRALCLATDVQFPDRIPHGPHGGGADSRIETAKQLAFGVPDQTGSKTVSEEFKLDVRILALARPVLAVDDPGFGRM
jgi:hypothetical protein